MVSHKNNCLTCKIKNCSILRECDDLVLSKINALKISRSIGKGKKLFSEGDPIQGVYFIKKGFLKVEVNGKRSRPLILRIAGKGEIFGHRMNPSHIFHTFTVTTISDTEYCYIPSLPFHNLATKSPCLQNQLLNEFLNEIETAE